MSAYIQFFIRGNDDTFYPVGTYSRSTAIYETFDEFYPTLWECIMPITKEVIDDVYNEVNSNIRGWKEVVKEHEADIERIGNFTNTTIDEKIEAIDNYNERIRDFNERIEELIECKTFLNVLSDMRQDAEDTKYYDNIKTINPDEYVYVGIEVGQPTIEDII